MSAPTTFTLNNGVEVPSVGLGVFQSPPDETRAAVLSALEAGYRMVDTAAAYGNEREVGQALRDSDLARDEVFVETKVWVSDYGYDATLHAWEKAAGKLGLEQIDLMILNQPLDDMAVAIDAYRALEKLLADGRVRAIGVSNFMVHHLERLLAETEVVPAVNQLEIHPYFQQRAVLSLGESHGILSQAWSPIGGITFYPGWGEERRSTLEDPVIGVVATAHGVTPAQVMLRWHLQQGRQVIPKSVNPERIRANLEVHGFDLTTDELAAIDALETGVRGGPDPDTVTLSGWGREIPEA